MQGTSIYFKLTDSEDQRRLNFSMHGQESAKCTTDSSRHRAARQAFLDIVNSLNATNVLRKRQQLEYRTKTHVRQIQCKHS